MSSELDGASVPRPRPGVAFKTIHGQNVLAHPVTTTLFVLNEVGSDVWNLMEQERSVDELGGLIAERYEVDADEARADVLDFLSDLRTHDLLDLG